MSGGLNQVIVLGRLADPPERIATKSGTVMLKAVLTVTTRRRTDGSNSEEQSVKIPVIPFGKTTEVFEGYVHPGELVQIIGRLHSYETKGQIRRLVAHAELHRRTIDPPSELQESQRYRKIRVHGSKSASKKKAPGKVSPDARMRLAMNSMNRPTYHFSPTLHD